MLSSQSKPFDNEISTTSICPSNPPAPSFAVKYLCFHILWKIEFNDIGPNSVMLFSLSLFAKVKIKLIKNIIKLDRDFVLKLKLQYLQQITSFIREQILAFADNWQGG